MEKEKESPSVGALLPKEVLKSWVGEVGMGRCYLLQSSDSVNPIICKKLLERVLL